MGGPCGASSDAPVPRFRYANLYGPPSPIGVGRRKTESIWEIFMSLAAHVLSHPLKHAAPSDLYDAAQSRQSALINLLCLLAGAPDLGERPPRMCWTAPSAHWSTWRPMPSGCMPPQRSAAGRRAHNRSRLSAVDRATGASGVAGESNRGRSPLLRPCLPVTVGATVCVEVLFVGWVELAKPMRSWRWVSLRSTPSYEGTCPRRSGPCPR
jgi:hypothetical protein